jgi:hypothetical protein
LGFSDAEVPRDNGRCREIGDSARNLVGYGATSRDNGSCRRNSSLLKPGGRLCVADARVAAQRSLKV